MYPKAKDAIIKNRITLLKLADKQKLKYILVSSALYEKQLLPRAKYAEIRDTKGEGMEMERMDVLLEWIESCNATIIDKVFDAFVEGVRRCDELNLARKIKKDAKGESSNGVQPSTSGPLNNGPASLYPDYLAPILGVIKPEAKVKTPKPKKVAPKVKLPKPPKVVIPTTTASTTTTEGETGTTVKPAGTPRTKSQVQRSSAPKATKGGKGSKANGTPKGSRRNSIKQAATVEGGVGSDFVVGGGISKNLEDLKILSPAQTPSRKRKSVASAAVSSTTTNISGFDPKTSLFGYRTSPNLKSISFAEARRRLESASKSFSFISQAVKPNKFNFDGECFYEGCTTPGEFGLCTRKVRPKGNGFICTARHENPTYVKVPRIRGTFHDGTEEMDILLTKSSVEILAGKSSDELAKMGDSEFRQLIQNTCGKELSLQVDAVKTLQKDLKKNNGQIWSLNGIVLVGEGVPPGKKQRG